MGPEGASIIASADGGSRASGTAGSFIASSCGLYAPTLRRIVLRPVSGWDILPKAEKCPSLGRGYRALANQVGKRYICGTCGSEMIVTKAGVGALGCCDGPMKLK
ncbi:MAG: hypothetical protein NTZ05_17575 [Chloroflexi bacterium]|nr:hypothetical protein [Chloroflexota bacterium]